MDNGQKPQFPLERPQSDNQFPISPVPGKIANKPPVQMDFFEALKKTVEGKRITRLAWETNDTFGEMKNEQLMIFIRGEYHSWTIVPGDITATDWIELPTQSKGN